jgi:hypothetical protein
VKSRKIRKNTSWTAEPINGIYKLQAKIRVGENGFQIDSPKKKQLNIILFISYLVRKRRFNMGATWEGLIYFVTLLCKVFK